MTAERYLPVIIDYCGVGQRFAVTDPVDLERAFSFFKEQGDSLGVGLTTQDGFQVFTEF